MFGLKNATGVSGAVPVIGAVLLQAIALYVGYGLLERLLGAALVDTLRGQH